MKRVVVALAFLLPAAAHGEPVPAVGAQVSTLGLGVEAQVPVGSFGLRGGVNALTLSPERTIDGVRYDADIELKSAGALIDWYPGFGGLRLSGGVRVNGNSVDLTATPNQTVNVGGTTYSPTQLGRLSGNVDFNRFAPYLGIGWQGAMANGRVLIGLDFGALYQGRPDVRLSATGAAANPALATDIAREEQAIEHDLGPFRFYPVISLTFSYRF